MPKIYTKVGDKGQTSLVGGQKVAKHDPRLDAYGTVDELNSILGWARGSLELVQISTFAKLNSDLEQLQHWLFNLGSLLATLPADRQKYKLPTLSQEQVHWIETRIDTMTDELAPLKQFIL